MAGFVKSFGVSFEYAIHEVSYSNIVLYSSVLPSYSTKGKGAKEAPINADDPSNNEKLRAALRGEIF